MKIVALDVLLWDIFADGSKKIGGAGSNFIYHLSSLGADATIISAIGTDELGAERQMEGIAKAKERGVAFGRKKQLTDEDVKALKAEREQGILIKDLMCKYRLSKATIYRYLSE
ncbi:MAG: helix-turn-helix domain-containing protein [Alphaproteobacteria bacterium]